MSQFAAIFAPGRGWLSILLGRSTSRLLLLLLALLLAEVAATTETSWLSLAPHALLLLTLALMTAASGEADRRIWGALMLIPVIRLVSMGLPLYRFPDGLWPGIAAAPVLAACVAAIRVSGLSRSAVGVHGRRLAVQVPLGGLGFPFAALGYLLLPEAPASAESGWVWISALGLTLIVAAFTDELLFRGILLATVRPLIGTMAVPVLALVYAILQLGHGSQANLVLALLMGLTYGHVAQRGGSIVGISIAHAVSNLMLFLVLPAVGLPAVIWLVVTGGTVGLLATGALLAPAAAVQAPWRLLAATRRAVPRLDRHVALVIKRLAARPDLRRRRRQRPADGERAERDAQFRRWGQRTFSLLIDHAVARDPKRRKALLKEAERIGARYGREAAISGLTLSEALENFLRLRSPMLRAVAAELRRESPESAPMPGTSRDASAGVDRVLLAVVRSHREASEAREGKPSRRAARRRKRGGR